MTAPVDPLAQVIERYFESAVQLYQSAGRVAQSWARAIVKAFGVPPILTIGTERGHAFTPDFDLACTHRGCLLLPEEH